MENHPAAQWFPHDTTLERWRSAARPTALARLLGNARSITVVAPHADDETLGCGGLIASASERGVSIRVVILTNGGASHPDSRLWPPERLAVVRKAEAEAAVSVLTGDRGEVSFAGARDGHLSDFPQAAGSIPRADILVTCWSDDPHPDHRAAFSLSLAAASAMDVRLLAFPLWTLTEGILPPPQHELVSLDVSPWVTLKRRALSCHASQLGQIVDDSRDGFVLTEDLQSLFVRGDELFLVAR